MLKIPNHELFSDHSSVSGIGGDIVNQPLEDGTMTTQVINDMLTDSTNGPVSQVIENIVPEVPVEHSEQFSTAVSGKGGDIVSQPLENESMMPQVINGMSSGSADSSSSQTIEDISLEDPAENSEQFSAAMSGGFQEVTLGDETDQCSGRLTVLDRYNRWIFVPRGQLTTIDVAISGGGYWYWRCGNTIERSRGGSNFRQRVKRLKILHSPNNRKITWQCFDLLFSAELPLSAAKKIRYSGLWNAGTEAQVWWPNCSEQQLRAKTSELWGSMRLAYMQPFVVGSKIRYNCLWTAGTAGQVWWPNCSEQDFRKTTRENWHWARPAQVYAFIFNGQVRYSCLWNKGTHSQVWWPNCSERDFRKETSENWSWGRPAQVQPFIVNGQVRYSCLWNVGKHGQKWNPNCSETHFRKWTSEYWSWARPAQVYGFILNGQVRYSVLWNAGTHGQVWWPNCSEQDFRKETSENWSWGRPAQMQAFVV